MVSRSGNGVSSCEVLADVGALALDHVPGQQFAVVFAVAAGQVGRQVAEAVVEQADQRLPGGVVAAVRCRGQQQQVPVGVVGELAQQRVAQVRLRGLGRAGGRHAGVGLVDDHQFRAVQRELVAVGVDEPLKHPSCAGLLQ